MPFSSGARYALKSNKEPNVEIKVLVIEHPGLK